MEIIINNDDKVRDLGVKNDVQVEEIDIQNSTVVGVQVIKLRSSHTYLYKTTFKNCRFTASELDNAVIKMCKWHQGDLRSIRLYGSEISDTEFNEIDISGGIFQDSKCEKVTFKDCNLENTNWSGSRIKKLDIRGSKIAGIKINPSQFHEITIDHSQAVYFSSLSGFTIK